MKQSMLRANEGLNPKANAKETQMRSPESETNPNQK
jgi:hypothetical protein